MSARVELELAVKALDGQIRCKHCGWQIGYDPTTEAWEHKSGNPAQQYFCWQTEEYGDDDYADPPVDRMAEAIVAELLEEA